MTAPISPPLPRAGQQRAWWRAPPRRQRAGVGDRAGRARARGLVLAIARDNHGAHQLESDLRTLLGDDADAAGAAVPGLGNPALRPVQPAPGHRLAAPGRAAPPADAQARHLVVPVQTLMQRLPPLRYVVGDSFDVRVRPEARPRRREAPPGSGRLPPRAAGARPRRLRRARRPARRVSRWARDAPYRIELFDDEIDSIRAFDPETQRSLDKVDAVRLLPGREVPLDDESRKRALRYAARTLRRRHRGAARCTRTSSDGVAPAGIEYYLPLFFEQTATLFDYLGRRRAAGARRRRARRRRAVLDADRRALRAAPPRHRTPAAAAGRAVPAAGAAARTAEPQCARIEVCGAETHPQPRRVRSRWATSRRRMLPIAAQGRAACARR